MRYTWIHAINEPRNFRYNFKTFSRKTFNSSIESPSTPIAERVYARLKLDLMKNDIEDFRVSDKAGREASLILSSKSGQPLTTGVSGLFTCKGNRACIIVLCAGQH
jgi:hypothetical protein